MTPEEKVEEYAIPAPTPDKMRALIEIIVNQTSWYYLCTFDDPAPFQPRSKKKKPPVNALFNTAFNQIDREEEDLWLLKKSLRNPNLEKAFFFFFR